MSADGQLQAPAAGASRSRFGAAGLLLAALAVAALVVQAAVAWQQHARPAFDAGTPGQRYAVQLQNGQMFFGVLRQVGPAHVQLEDVYYVQPFTGPDGVQGNRLVSRKKNDWHGPENLMIPADKVVTMELVGTASQLATLIAQDKAQSPAQPAGPVR
ncbi:hypothetical protein ACFFTM_23085 [Pseudoduganella plicata]|uniref:Uncharacterized protein n=1 Tax=Pseudoduganella plicata TaxID=321984 RepID=A0A4P7BG13_9BURK|nr:hypothetical protein [Pseudoduganella plicata]QBQ36369.1 hypothetical protein E1742_09500 [Pseudoduganella plicata]GGY75744.1 hypothetical protein GCM10007388_05370 [Pseudoduganella plicata]